MKHSLTIPGTSDKLDMDAFTHCILKAPDSPARDFMLALLQTDAAEPTHARLTELLASPLEQDSAGKISLTLPESIDPLVAHRTTGMRPASFYRPPAISRRAVMKGGLALGGATAFATALSAPGDPETPLAQPPMQATAAQRPNTRTAPSPVPDIPWQSIVAGTSVAGLGYVIARMMKASAPTLGRETSRRSLLGMDYAHSPLDSTHAAENLLNILNSFLPEREASRSR